MLESARNIWDTRIQCVCGIIVARDTSGIEIYFSGNFGQVSLSPPRVAINPNRLYPIEGIIRRTGLFSINVISGKRRAEVHKLLNLRRREPRKVEVVGLTIIEDSHGIPFLDGSLRTIFCEIEQVLDTGDHTLMIAKVLESRVNVAIHGEAPLLFPEAIGRPSRFPAIKKTAQAFLARTGILDFLRNILYRRRPQPSANIAQTTYMQGGQTEKEIAEILKYGDVDHSRQLTPPAAPAIVRKQIGICVVGTNWGAFHTELIRKANPLARVFICGRDQEKTARMANVLRADDYFLDLEAAVKDSRVQALTIALPARLHRPAVEAACAAGKHVLVEKPIATSLADADAMIHVAQRAGTILMVAEDMHFRPIVSEAVRHIALGKIGEPLYLLAHAGGVRGPKGGSVDEDPLGGILMDIGVHYIRAMRLLMGEPDRVFASRAMQLNTKIAGEDSLQMQFASRYGWESHMLLSWASNRGHLPDLTIMGDRGTFHIWPATSYLDYYPVEPRPLTRMLSFVRPAWLQSKLFRPSFQRQRIYSNSADQRGYETEFREFLAAISELRASASPPEEARRDLEILHRIYEAMRTGNWVEVSKSNESKRG